MSSISVDGQESQNALRNLQRSMRKEILNRRINDTTDVEFPPQRQRMPDMRRRRETPYFRPRRRDTPYPRPDKRPVRRQFSAPLPPQMPPQPKNDSIMEKIKETFKKMMPPEGSRQEMRPAPQTPAQDKNQNFLRAFILVVSTVFVVLLYLYTKRNPRSCTKRECEVRVPAGDNALSVVAAHLGSNCSAAEKSTAVKMAVAKTLEEIDYA